MRGPLESFGAQESGSNLFYKNDLIQFRNQCLSLKEEYKEKNERKLIRPNCLNKYTFL